jgi:C4-dicarboxylate transporter DctM subunit
MSPPLIGLIGIIVLLVLFAIEVPVAFSMLLAGVVGFCYLINPAAGLSLLGSDVYSQLSQYSFTAIPMFVLGGNIAFESGLGQRLFSAAYALLWKLPGGLAVAATVACAGFGAVCGSSTACTATMGKIALPIMKQYKYDDGLSAGSIAVAGTLGVLIPPSTVFIIYGILTEQSIGKLFIAGILPGILLTALLAATIIILCLRNPLLGPIGPPSTTKQKRVGFIGITETVVIFLFIIGGMFLGWFSPTQGGAILTAVLLLLAVARKQMSWKKFLFALKDSVRITCIVMFIVTSAIIFGRFIAVSKIPTVLAGLLSGLHFHPIAVMAIIMFFYMVAGCFMDSMALLTLTMPIIFPTVIALKFDPIWFGVMMVLVGEMGVITPPVGVNVFVMKTVAREVPLVTIFKGITPFIFTIAVALGIMLFFPQIATVLPNFMTY